MAMITKPMIVPPMRPEWRFQNLYHFTTVVRSFIASLSKAFSKYHAPCVCFMVSMRRQVGCRLVWGAPFNSIFGMSVSSTRSRSTIAGVSPCHQEVVRFYVQNRLKRSFDQPLNIFCLARKNRFQQIGILVFLRLGGPSGQR